LCTFLGRAAMDLVLTVKPGCGLSPLETGCTGNPCRVPRRQQGGQKRGAAEPIDAGSGGASPLVRDRAEGPRAAVTAKRR
jgi:hypothetical protein